ncbi:MAG: GNAT family N-acetyltransferase [Colwellia sp.]
MTSTTIWQHKKFSALSPDQLYDLLKLRSDIFVVEQTCIYSDLDSKKNNKDRHAETIHLLGYQAGELVAYLRLLAKDQSYPDHLSIGRVVIATQARGNGIGHELLTEGLALCRHYFPNENIKISAQQHLKSYYAQHGFVQISAIYLEDDIPHIGMLKESSPTK